MAGPVVLGRLRAINPGKQNINKYQEVLDKHLKKIARFDLVHEVSRSRRVEGNRTLLDFDVTELLGSLELQEFQEQTGLRKSPVTLVLPEYQGKLPRPLTRDQVLVVFLHGMRGGRESWGIGDTVQALRESLVLKLLRSLEDLGKEAVGLVLAGLGHDCGNLNSTVSGVGITPQHYSRQLEYILRYLDFLRGEKIIGIGHSVGAAALWEFASRSLFNTGDRMKRSPNVSVVAISPVRAIAESRFLTVGCQIAGRALDLLLRPVLSLWRFSSRRLSTYLAMASVLKGLARQGTFRGSLAGVKGLVLIGERDWVARRGLSAALQRAGCKWPVAQLAGLGHDLLRHPATESVLINHLPSLL